jgi:hypothetical protein
LTSKVYAPDKLNPQATIVVDAQTDIKVIIKNGVLKGAPISVIQEKVRLTIERAVKRLSSEALKAYSRVSLMNFANRLYFGMKSSFPNPIKAVAIYTLVKAVTESIEKGKTLPTAEVFIPTTTAEKTAFKQLYGETFHTDAKGIPLQEFQKVYIKRVESALDQMAQANALDPNDITGRNGLRNLAEMQVRYEDHLKDVATLKDKGVKLVVCSVHGDCSLRCSRWQGRVYSLDGTYGTTEDGKEYVPLEEATNQEQVYKTNVNTGTQYKGGLFGYNCRHKLYPYKEGMVIPSVSAREQVVERDITRRQRELERNVLHWREEALMYKGVNPKRYKYAKAKADSWYTEYRNYSKSHGRAYYPDRVKIL